MVRTKLKPGTKEQSNLQGRERTCNGSYRADHRGLQTHKKLIIKKSYPAPIVK